MNKLKLQLIVNKINNVYTNCVPIANNYFTQHIILCVMYYKGGLHIYNHNI